MTDTHVTAAGDAPATPAEAPLVGRGLAKSYFRARRDAAGTFDAVAEADIALRPGELVALMGRSGGGKSTLLMMLAGLLTPSSGTVTLAGCDLYALGDAERARMRNELVGVVPQGQTPLGDLNVIDNVCLPWTMYRDPADVVTRAEALLEHLGIADLALAMPAELSGGELRRMALARALVCEPAVLLADEPTGDLDDENTALVLGTLRAAARRGAAVLLVTHEPTAASFADRVLRMDAGRLEVAAAPGAPDPQAAVARGVTAR